MQYAICAECILYKRKVTRSDKCVIMCPQLNLKGYEDSFVHLGTLEAGLPVHGEGEQGVPGHSSHPGKHVVGGRVPDYYSNHYCNSGRN